MRLSVEPTLWIGMCLLAIWEGPNRNMGPQNGPLFSKLLPPFLEVEKTWNLEKAKVI